MVQLSRHLTGHIIDLPKDKISIDIENNFKPIYKTMPGKSKIVSSLGIIIKVIVFYWLQTMTEKVMQSRGIVGKR